MIINIININIIIINIISLVTFLDVTITFES